MRQVQENFSDGVLYFGPHQRFGSGQPAARDQVPGERGLLDDHLEHDLAEPPPLPIELLCV